MEVNNISRKYLGYLFLIVAIAIGGCICFPGQPEQSIGGEIITITPVPTSIPIAGQMTEQAQVTAQAAPAKPFDMSKSTWVEYKVTANKNGQPATSDLKLEYGSDTSGGSSTQRVKKTTSSNDVSSINTTTPGKLFSMQSSNTQTSSSFSSLVPFEQLKNDDPVLSADSVTGNPAGSESVTVPKGSFECRKYMGNFKGAESTYWAAAGIPVPIKIYTACDGTTMELTDWG